MTIEGALAAIDRSAAAALAGRLIRVRSCNPPGEEAGLARLVAEELDGWGMVAELDVFDGARANLLARLSGAGAAPPLVFGAHFDTVPEGEEPWAHPPYGGVIAEGRVWGRGAADMKGGMAAMLAAARALAESGARPPGDVVLAFTSGETSDLVGARRLVERGALAGAGAYLVSEPTGLAVAIAEKAALWVEATARGRVSHGSQPHAGANAIAAMARFLSALEGFRFTVPTHPLLGGPTIAVGTIEGGVAINVTPDRCRATLDVRLLPEQDPAAALAQLQSLAGEAVALAAIDFKPAVETAACDPFVACALAAREAELGDGGTPIGASYYTDGAVIANALDLPMVILGPGGMEMTHQPDEYVTVEALEAAARMFVRIAMNHGV